MANTEVEWSASGGYRLQVRDLGEPGERSTQGFQVIPALHYKINSRFKISFNVEVNGGLFFSKRPPANVSQAQVLAASFPGIQPRLIDGKPVTTFSGVVERMDHSALQVLPEVRLTFNPSWWSGLELVARLAVDVNRTSFTTVTTVTETSNGPVPGGMAISKEYGPYQRDEVTWNYPARFGFGAGLKVNDYFKPSAEMLFLANPNYIDRVLRIQTQIGVAGFFAQPRYIYAFTVNRRSEEIQTNGLDLVVGYQKKF